MSSSSSQSLSAPSFQKVEVIPNKVDEDGNHYLKVLLLSNKKTKNNWIAPYKNIGKLPKEVLDSFRNIPHISKHNHQYFDKRDEELKKQGLDREQRRLELLKEANELKDGYIDWLFLENPNATALYGQLKVTSPEENKYIEEHGIPSHVFTSPALSGVWEEDENGTKVYKLDTMRAWHLAGVPIPAFDEDEAMVKGICKNGNSESCRDYLMYAGVDSVVQAPFQPSENVNNTCSCNSNIDSKMSENLQNTPTPQQPVNSGGELLKPNEVKYTIEAPVSDKPTDKPVEKIIERNSAQEVLKSEKQIKEDREKELMIQENEALKKQVLEQKNFFLDEMLSVHIPKSNFEKEEDYNAEKNIFKTFINKYEVSLEDAKWLITKAVNKPAPVQAPVPEETTKGKKTGKENQQYAGFEGPGTAWGSHYQPDFLTKPPTKSGSFLENKDQQSTVKKNKEYPIIF